VRRYYLPIIPLILLFAGAFVPPGTNIELGTFGKINPLYFLGSTEGSLINNVLTANAGQAGFAVVYFLYNGVVTTMFMAKEWSDFSVHAKGLRVSSKPQGCQRSTYFLSLPYRYAAPLLLMSGFMHWALSEAIFVVNVQAYAFNDEYSQRTRMPDLDVDTIGYSPSAVLLVMFILVFMFVVQLTMGARALDPKVPFVGANSILISSACRPLEDGAAFSRLKLVVDRCGEGTDGCHFTTEFGAISSSRSSLQVGA